MGTKYLASLLILIAHQGRAIWIEQQGRAAKDIAESRRQPYNLRSYYWVTEAINNINKEFYGIS